MKKWDDFDTAPLDGQLLDAVIANDQGQVEDLLAQGANPNCFEDSCEIQPLHFASVYNATEVIFPLIQAGAKINATTAEGYTPMDIAKQLKHEETIALLKQLSANLVSFYDT